MKKSQSQAGNPSFWRKKLRRAAMASALVLAFLWLIHPPVLGWMVKSALVKAASQEAMKLEIRSLSVSLARPLVIEGIRLRSKNPEKSLTSLDADKAELSFNLFPLLTGNGRALREIRVTKPSGVLDVRSEPATPGTPTPEKSKPEESASYARYFPMTVETQEASLEIRGDDFVCSIQNSSFRFSESALGLFTAKQIDLRAGTANHTFGPLTATTAWKAGTAYLTGLSLFDGLRIENLAANFLYPGGIAVTCDASLFGGLMRADCAFNTTGGTPALDAIAWASNVAIAPVFNLLGQEGMAGGLLREGRITFRGDPEKIGEAQASLHMAANDFRWNKRGWQSLEASASLINKRLSITEFQLRQKDNSLSLNGEMTLNQGWEGLKQSPFLLNISGSIRNLGELAGLLGAPFDEMTGLMSLNGSLSGSSGKFDGYLNLEASKISFRDVPLESARLQAVFRNNEAEIALCEIWSGKDFFKGKGTVELFQPFRYAGEVQLSAQDAANYTVPFHTPGAESILGGALTLNWQGDGNSSAHSGAFTATLKDFISEATPGGLTGRFEGTYSPQNLYFRDFQISHGPLQFTTQATLAASGITIKDASLQSRSVRLLDANMFLPIDAFACASGKPWMQSVIPAKNAYAHVTTPKDISLKDLLNLTGQQATPEGSLRLTLDASGPLESLQLQASLAGRGLGMKVGDTQLPLSNLEATITSAQGVAELSGTLRTQGLTPITLQAKMPFGLVKDSAGLYSLLNPQGTVQGTIEFPRTDIALLHPFLPKVRRVAGTLSGQIAITNTIAEPYFDGRMELQRGVLEVTAHTPPVTNLDVLLRFKDQRAMIERFRGGIGAGPFDLSGSVDFKEVANPVFDLTFIGRKILLARDASLRLRANTRLTAHGDANGGIIEGNVRFVDGRIYQRIELTPLLVPTPAEESAIILAPQLDGIPPFFAPWKLDVHIDNETPFLIAGNIASGQVTPDVRLIGTIGIPIPVGRITFENARAYLPFTTMTISNGQIDFTEQNPWIPTLDFRGSAEILDYEVHALAYGPLNDRKLVLRSDPPLAQESLILLLTTGIAPGVNSGAGFGEAAVGQGGFLLLRTFIRQLNSENVDLDSLANRVQVQSLPPQNQSEKASLRGKFRLNNNFSIMAERDGSGFYNAGVTYSLRFR